MIPIMKRPTVRRLSREPIVAPASVQGYGAIFNAGVIHHDGIYHLFARGVRDGYRRNHGSGPRFTQYISDILIFTSVDGLRYEFQQVLAQGSPDGVFSYEDPRVQKVNSQGVDHIVMTYTNLPDSVLPESWRIGIHHLVFDGDRFALDENSGHVVGPSQRANKDAVVFNLKCGKVALAHRIHPNVQLAVFEHLEDLLVADDNYWDAHLEWLDHHTILEPSAECVGVGAGAPPIATVAGLLLFYHERRADGTYTMNAALLDHSSGRVVSRLDHPILCPELPWERTGDVDRVVFVGGAHRHDDGSIYLTYGAADRAVGAGTIGEAELIDALVSAAA